MQLIAPSKLLKLRNEKNEKTAMQLIYNQYKEKWLLQVTAVHEVKNSPVHIYAGTVE